MDADTIHVGHSLGNDLRAMKLVHNEVVDMCIGLLKLEINNDSVKL